MLIFPLQCPLNSKRRKFTQWCNNNNCYVILLVFLALTCVLSCVRANGYWEGFQRQEKTKDKIRRSVSSWHYYQVTSKLTFEKRQNTNVRLLDNCVIKHRNVIFLSLVLLVFVLMKLHCSGNVSVKLLSHSA